MKKDGTKSQTSGNEECEQWAQSESIAGAIRDANSIERINKTVFYKPTRP